MKKNVIVKWLGWLIGLAAIVGLVALAPMVHAYVQVLTAHAAKITCSERFVAKRPTADIVAVDVQGRVVLGLPLFRAVSVSVDDARQRVTSSLLGLPLYQDEAVHREGLGCVMVRTDSAETLQAAAGPTVTIERDSTQTWPQGGRVDYPDNPQLESALASAFINPRTGQPNGARGIVVIHNGQLIGERYADGFDASTPMPGRSMAKSVTAMLAGIAFDQSGLTVESTDLFPEWQDERADIRLGDLLAMSDGLDFVNGPTNPASDELASLYKTSDTVAFARAKSAAHAPNTVMNYNNGAPALVSSLIRKQFANDEAYLNFPYEQLFAPLGIASAVIETDGAGTHVGASLMYATVRDWARLGQLMLQDGVWNGQQVLPAGWADYMTTPNDTTNVGWYSQGFVWLGHTNWNQGQEIPADDYWFEGFDGQYVVVVPSRNVVIARLGFTPDEDWNTRPDFVGPILQALP